MAWETRKRGDWYYTRTRREHGRFVREYVGGGIVGEVAAMLDAEERAERDAERARMRAEHEQAREVSEALAALEAVTREAIADVLHAEGFHRHNRTWRRKRG